MIKEILIKDLKEYKENLAKLKLRKREKQKCENRLTQYKREESSITGIVGINCDIHSKNSISNKTESTAIDNIDNNAREIEEAEKRIKELEVEIVELEDKVQDINIRLSALKYKEKEILFAFYVEGRSYEDIGNNLFFKLFSQTRDTEAIKIIVKKAMDKMIKL